MNAGKSAEMNAGKSAEVNAGKSAEVNAGNFATGIESDVDAVGPEVHGNHLHATD
jgi:hypothetical protein